MHFTVVATKMKLAPSIEVLHWKCHSLTYPFFFYTVSYSHPALVLLTFKHELDCNALFFNVSFCISILKFEVSPNTWFKFVIQSEWYSYKQTKQLYSDVLKKIKFRHTSIMVDFLNFFTENTSLMKYTMASKLAISQYLHLMIYHFIFTKIFVIQSLSSSQTHVEAKILVL